MSRAYQIMYRLGITPWEHREPPVPLTELVEGPGALPPGDMLDIGCGTGHDAIYCARHGWTVTGVDVVGRAVATARRNAARLARASVSCRPISPARVPPIWGAATRCCSMAAACTGCGMNHSGVPSRPSPTRLSRERCCSCWRSPPAAAAQRPAASTRPGSPRFSRSGISRSAAPPARSRSTGPCAMPVPPGTSSSGGDLAGRAAQGIQRWWKCGLRGRPAAALAARISAGWRPRSELPL